MALRFFYRDGLFFIICNSFIPILKTVNPPLRRILRGTPSFFLSSPCPQERMSGAYKVP